MFALTAFVAAGARRRPPARAADCLAALAVLAVTPVAHLDPRTPREDRRVLDRRPVRSDLPLRPPHAGRPVRPRALAAAFGGSELQLRRPLVLAAFAGAFGPDGDIGSRRSATSRFLFSFAGLVAIYWISTNPIASHLTDSSDRTIDSLVFGGALLVPVLLPSSASPSRESSDATDTVASRSKSSAISGSLPIRSRGLEGAPARPPRATPRRRSRPSAR